MQKPLQNQQDNYETLIEEHQAILQNSRIFGLHPGKGASARDTYHYNTNNEPSRKVVYKVRGSHLPKEDQHWHLTEDRGALAMSNNTKLIRTERLNIKEMLTKLTRH